jgi:hypothetical protein
MLWSKSLGAKAVGPVYKRMKRERFMSDAMPRFSYRFVTQSNRRVLCIEEDGRVIHEVTDVMAFYEVFGYRRESTHTDMLPDEVIWSEYVANSSADFSHCVQMHLVQYLKEHSEAFNARYGAIYDKLVAMHEELRASRGVSCFACRAFRAGEG